MAYFSLAVSIWFGQSMVIPYDHFLFASKRPLIKPQLYPPNHIIETLINYPKVFREEDRDYEAKNDAEFIDAYRISLCRILIPG